MGKKLTELISATSANDTDLLPIVTNPATSPESKKITLANLIAGKGLTDNDAWTAKGDLIVGNNADSAAILNVGSNNKIIVADSSQACGMKWVDSESGINLMVGSGYDVISTGTKFFIEIPFACTITAIRMFADVSGSIVIDLYKDSYTNFPPNSSDSMVGGATKPNITSAQKSEMTSFSGWSATSFAKGDILAVNVDSCASIKLCTLSLSLKKIF